ncbi:MAG: PKD domain-containing protein, partial [Candidatus Thermoplasmatota archaeon]|nr:PKD domain-containing protein [Candidatus Thermoplasmatota archaeon]
MGTPYQRSTEVEMYIQGSRRSWRDIPFEETSAGFGVKILDLDLDGNNDIIFGTADEGIKAFLGQGETTLTGFPHTEVSNGLPDSDGNWNQVELGDINGDGLPDLISACNTRDTVNVYLNDLPGGWNEIFTGSDELIVGGDPYGANFGDWDGDGQLDVAGCGWDGGVNAWLVGGSTGGNILPIAYAGDDITANIGDTVTLDGRDSEDPDGEIVEWEWICTSHPSLVLEDADTSRPRFTPDEEGTYRFTLRVMDDEDEWSGISSVKVAVLDPTVNYPPVAEAGSSLSAEVGETVHLDGSASYDPDGEIVGWDWTCTSHTMTMIDADTSMPGFVPEEEGEYKFRLIVEDDGGELSDPDVVSVHVGSGIVYVNPNVGPIRYDDGEPVVGASVTMTGGENSYTRDTDANGYARFTMGVLPGDYDVKVDLEGKTVLTFS